jgi:uncharacterized protein YcnI
VSAHRPRRTRLARLVGIGAFATVAATLSTAGPAFAHVTVHPQSVPAGTSDIELTFRVPNERDDANTVGLQVFFPADLPLLTVDVLPVPGWAARVATRTLAAPVTTDDGSVTQVVSDITWTATAGGIAPGQYQDFDVAVGQVPSQPGGVVFKSLQTYSSGEVVRWIEVASSQDPDPDSPAPVLTVTPAPAAGAPVAATSGGSGSTEAVAVAALVVSVIALVGVIVLLARTRRPTAADPPDGTAAVDPGVT